MTVILGVILIVVVICIGPALMLWAINTLAAAGGSAFYIPHGFWTYLAALVILAMVGSSSKASK